MIIPRQPLFVFLSIFASIGAFVPSLLVARPRHHGNGLHPIRSSTLESTEATEAGVLSFDLTPTASSSTEGQSSKSAESALRPGLDENEKFECDEYVQFWRDFQSGGFASGEENTRSLADVAASFTSLGPEGLSYWLVCLSGLNVSRTPPPMYCSSKLY
jgi:hypothetical protein